PFLRARPGACSGTQRPPGGGDHRLLAVREPPSRLLPALQRDLQLFRRREHRRDIRPLARIPTRVSTSDHSLSRGAGSGRTSGSSVSPQGNSGPDFVTGRKLFKLLPVGDADLRINRDLTKLCGGLIGWTRY